MNVKKCNVCGTKLVRNGKTKSGSQRWLCKHCKMTNVIKNDNDFYKFKRFLDWLLSKNSQVELKTKDRTFRKHNEKYWKYWALSDYVDEIHDVIYCDGLYLTRRLVILIATTKNHCLGWYLAKSENSNSWASLLSKIAPPAMVVTDGGRGFHKAVSLVWPATAVQRCTFHIAQQTRRYTTSNPKLPAGRELLNLSRLLLKVRNLEQCDAWKDAYIQWCLKWENFLKEQTVNESNEKVYTHQRLRKARRALNQVLHDDSLFTYLNPILPIKCKTEATNNVIEGRVNAQLRAMLRYHRGLSPLKRAKACFWWCYLDSEYKVPMSEMLKSMITDEEIDKYYKSQSIYEQNNLSIELWGDGIVWNEFHNPTPYPFHYD